MLKIAMIAAAKAIIVALWAIFTDWLAQRRSMRSRPE